MNKFEKYSRKTLLSALLLVLCLLSFPQFCAAYTGISTKSSLLKSKKATAELAVQIIDSSLINFLFYAAGNPNIQTEAGESGNVKSNPQTLKSKVTLRTVVALFCLVLIIMIAAVRVVLVRKIRDDNH